MRVLVDDDNLRVRLVPLKGGRLRLVVDYPATADYASKVRAAVRRLLGLSLRAAE